METQTTLVTNEVLKKFHEEQTARALESQKMREAQVVPSTNESVFDPSF